MSESRSDKPSSVGALRRALAFGVGSVLILQEKTESFVEEAIARGQKAQAEGRRMVQEAQARRRKRRPQRIDAVDVRINQAMERMNVPTHKELKELDRQIRELAERVDALKPEE